LRLREAATDQTKLVIADFVLPLACVDDFGSGEGKGNGGETKGGVDGVEGAERMLAPAPLLANLGKASANAYWMDLTVCHFFLLSHARLFMDCVVDASNVQRAGTHTA